MRRGLRPLVVGLCLHGVASATGCAKLPLCTVSPVDIEETREDSILLEKGLVAARDRAGQLKAELAARQAELDSKKDVPEELRKKLDDLKKGSGRIEKKKK